MENNNLVLWYISNKCERKYLVKDLEHAFKLTDAIAESDLLDDEIDFNSIDLVDNDTGDSWFSEDDEDFDECYRKWLDNIENM